MVATAGQVDHTGKTDRHPKRRPSPASTTESTGNKETSGAIARAQRLACLAAVRRSCANSGAARKTPKDTDATAAAITAAKSQPLRQPKVPAGANTEATTKA